MILLFEIENLVVGFWGERVILVFLVVGFFFFLDIEEVGFEADYEGRGEGRVVF